MVQLVTSLLIALNLFWGLRCDILTIQHSLLYGPNNEVLPEVAQKNCAASAAAVGGAGNLMSLMSVLDEGYVYSLCKMAGLLGGVSEVGASTTVSIGGQLARMEDRDGKPVFQMSWADGSAAKYNRLSNKNPVLAAMKVGDVVCVAVDCASRVWILNNCQEKHSYVCKTISKVAEQQQAGSTGASTADVGTKEEPASLF